MALKIVIFACVVAVARGSVVAPVVAAPAVAARLEEFDPRPQYSFGYDVSDAVSGDYKSQQEVRDGDVVQGSYSLVDPDGTRRIVDYAADPVNGFNAVVRREPLVVAAPEVVEPAIVSARYVSPAVAAPVVAAKISAPVAAAPIVAARYTAPVAAAPVVAARYTAPVAAAPVVAARYTAPVAAAPVVAAGYTAPVASAPVVAPRVSAPLVTAPAYANYAYEPLAYTAPVARYSAVAYTAPVARYSTAYTAPTGAVARLTVAPAAVAV